MKNNIIAKNVSWKSYQSILSSIRKTVFIEEQSVPQELEMDGNDHKFEHFLVFKESPLASAPDNGIKPIGCGRMLIEGNQAKIGRMAILSEFRNLGIGSVMLKAMEAYAVENNIEQINLSAQVHAIPFYLKNGYSLIGEQFIVANIVHQNMFKALSIQT